MTDELIPEPPSRIPMPMGLRGDLGNLEAKGLSAEIVMSALSEFIGQNIEPGTLGKVVSRYIAGESMCKFPPGLAGPDSFTEGIVRKEASKGRGEVLVNTESGGGSRAPNRSFNERTDRERGN